MSNLRNLQQTLPWGAHDYNEGFRTREDPQRDAGHAMLHVVKASGKLAGLLDEFDHSDPANHSYTHDDASKYLADILICVARVANRWPGGAVDLSSAIERRLAQKFRGYKPAPVFNPMVGDDVDNALELMRKRIGELSSESKALHDVDNDDEAACVDRAILEMTEMFSAIEVMFGKERSHA